MCIAILCTSHPDYPYILLSNRDEYLSRPTARAHFWDPPHSHVLGGRDLHRPVRGTWLGITRYGRLAVLTNFRDDDTQPLDISGRKSRGAMVNSYLCADEASGETTEGFAKRLVEEEGVSDVGGFSLLFGRLRPFDSSSSSSSSPSPPSSLLSSPSDSKADGVKTTERQGLAIVSNRSETVGDVTWLATAPTEVHALSNSHFGDLTWPKVVHGEQFVRQAVQSNVQRAAGKQDLLNRLFEILSLDTLGEPREGEGWEGQLRKLRESIFIPRIGQGTGDQEGDNGGRREDIVVTSGNGWYGTQKQTVILVDRNGHVDFIEKTLFDERGRPLEDSMEEFSFDIEGWVT